MASNLFSNYPSTMNRFLPLLIALGAFSGPLFSQNISLCNQVLASGGKQTVQQGNTWAWTVGEPVIFTLGPIGNHLLTQGFHQPDLCLPVSTQESSLAEWSIEVFPNPATDRLFVRFSDVSTGDLHARVFDLMGRPVLSDAVLDTPEGTLLDCADWQAGVYFLQLVDARTSATATIRFIRL